jgi:IS30 family transposase
VGVAGAGEVGCAVLGEFNRCLQHLGHGGGRGTTAGLGDGGYRKASDVFAGAFPNDGSMRISHEAIYQVLYVQGRGALRRELAACLRTGRALRVPRARARTKRGEGFLTDQVMISQRPVEVEDRAVPGHWEGDLIIGLGGTAIGTLVERTTRFTMLLHVPPMDGHDTTARGKNPLPLAGHGAEAVRDAIASTITTLPAVLRKTLTWDQGREMAQHAQLSIDTNLQIYFCDPHSP